MRYQILLHGLVVDQNLSYEEALMYLEDPIMGSYYVMEPMKESD